VGSQIEHLLRKLWLGDVLEIWFLVANLVGISQRQAYEPVALRLKSYHALASRQHDPTERN
jgi:hypothetical protein